MESTVLQHQIHFYAKVFPAIELMFSLMIPFYFFFFFTLTKSKLFLNNRLEIFLEGFDFQILNGQAIYLKYFSLTSVLKGIIIKIKQNCQYSMVLTLVKNYNINIIHKTRKIFSKLLNQNATKYITNQFIREVILNQLIKCFW